MRLPSVLDPDALHPAERCALRLDGDAFALGDGLIAADEPEGPPQRALAVGGEARRLGLVLGGWTAAWVHGATPRLRRPLDLQVDLGTGARTKRTPVREVLLGPRDVVRIEGIRVTAPFRTATDLARLEAEHDGETGEVLRALLAAAGLTPAQAVALFVAGPVAPNKLRGLARLRALRDA